MMKQFFIQFCFCKLLEDNLKYQNDTPDASQNKRFFFFLFSLISHFSSCANLLTLISSLLLYFFLSHPRRKWHETVSHPFTTPIVATTHHPFLLYCIPPSLYMMTLSQSIPWVDLLDTLFSSLPSIVRRLHQPRQLLIPRYFSLRGKVWTEVCNHSTLSRDAFAWGVWCFFPLYLFFFLPWSLVWDLVLLSYLYWGIYVRLNGSKGGVKEVLCIGEYSPYRTYLFLLIGEGLRRMVRLSDSRCNHLFFCASPFLMLSFPFFLTASCSCRKKAHFPSAPLSGVGMDMEMQDILLTQEE